MSVFGLWILKIACKRFSPSPVFPMHVSCCSFCLCDIRGGTGGGGGVGRERETERERDRQTETDRQRKNTHVYTNTERERETVRERADLILLVAVWIYVIIFFFLSSSLLSRLPFFADCSHCYLPLKQALIPWVSLVMI